MNKYAARGACIETDTPEMHILSKFSWKSTHNADREFRIREIVGAGPHGMQHVEIPQLIVSEIKYR